MTNLYYIFFILVMLTLFYEAAARTNLRPLMRFGIPIYRQQITLPTNPLLLEHIDSLSRRLNPPTNTPPPVWQRLLFLMPAFVPSFLLLPVTEDELVWRRGNLGRGIIRYQGSHRQLTVGGYFTWPSLFAPVLLIFAMALFPILFVPFLAMVLSLWHSQRQMQTAVTTILRHEFAHLLELE